MTIVTFLITAGDGSCGVIPQPLSGKETQNQWPWMSILKDSNGDPFCDGALLSDQWVLSAAHCLTR